MGKEQGFIDQIASGLKSSKAQGLTYYQAEQNLLKKGWSQEQINQVSDEFPYDLTRSTNSANDNKSAQSDLTGTGLIAQEEIKNMRLDGIPRPDHTPYSRVSHIYGAYVVRPGRNKKLRWLFLAIVLIVVAMTDYYHVQEFNNYEKRLN